MHCIYSLGLAVKFWNNSHLFFSYDVFISYDVQMLIFLGVQWLSGRVLDSRPRGRGFEPHLRHCDVSLSKSINPSLVLVQPRKTRPCLNKRLLIGRKESNQTKIFLSC